MINLHKAAISILLIAFTSFTVLALSTLPISKNSQLCESKHLKPLIPWSSGCLYTTLNRTGYSVSQDEIEAEKAALDKFNANAGIDEHILLYRLKFHQKYRLKFKTSYQELHTMYLEYRKSEHFFLNHHTDYISYLASNNLRPLAQSTLNDYCATYIQDEEKFKHLVDTLKQLLEYKNTNLDFMHCYSPFDV